MLNSRDLTVCWLMRHEGAVLVVGEQMARVLDSNYQADSVSMQAALSLLAPERIIWFDVEVKSGRKLLRIAAGGEAYHRRLVEKKKCSCPRSRKAAGA